MAVVTGAQGQAMFKLSDDGQSITYKLNVANIENVTQAHIHVGALGVNGGIVAWLFPQHHWRPSFRVERTGTSPKERSPQPIWSAA